VTCPPVVVFTSELAASEETKRFVEEAVVAVTIVVEAKGIDRGPVAGASKLIVRAGPTSAPVPESEMAVPATGAEVATEESAFVPLP
jgi:hypothetical protein